MTTLQQVELGVLGPLQVRQYGLPVAIPGAKPRTILTMLGLHGGSVVPADLLVELLWGDDPPRTAAKALQTHISSLRRALGDGFVLTQGMGWTLSTSDIDAYRYKLAAKLGREAFASGDVSQAVTCFDEALTLWRGIPELPDGARGISEKTRWIEGHAALVEERADAMLATGRAAEIIGELEAAIADAPLRERRWGHLMLALYRAGRQGEALGAYQRARSLLADELGVDPGPDLRRLEAAIVAQDDALEIPVSQQLSSVMRAVTFLLTDIEGSTAAWEADADAMAVALARHDEIVEQVVTSRGGRLVKTRGEGDATFSVFDRPSAAAAAAIDLQEAIRHEQWALAAPVLIRVALHTGEVELRDGDYFGRAVNRAARLRSLATGGQILCSGATAELVIDTLADDVVLADLGMRQLKNLARPEHVFELRLETADDSDAPTTDVLMERPSLPAVLAGPGPFVGRGSELERLMSAYQQTLDEGTSAVLIAGEPGVGKTRLAGEWSRQAFEQGAVVLYGRCDEDLEAPYQPFAEALRSLVPCLGAERVRGLRGVEALLPLVPGLTDVLPDLAAPPRADPDTERYALFDAVVALLGVASTSAPVVLILDDLHWAAKPTLLLLRHLLRFGEHARVQIVGTYRSTDLDRSHPLAAMLADLHRDGSSHRLQLSGLDEDDVSAYVAEAGYDDEELARALASVTGGNPFFLIEALRHVDESGGRWDPSTLPQGVREAVSRRLSRLPAQTNKALAAAAVVGSRFALTLVESVVGQDLIDAFDEASKAGIVIEEAGGRYRFNHAIVRQSLLAELASVRRMRLHQRIAATLETEPGADDELLAELAYHYFECAWAGNAAKAVEYCRRAADQAMARLAYEGAADLYDKALHALEEIDDELPDRDDQQAELLVVRCEALLAAGDVVSAKGAVSQLQEAASDSARLAAWGTCFDGQLSILTDPERLDEIESALGAAAEELAGLEDAAGEAKAHTVRAGCLARLGRIGDCEAALDQALTAARRAREHRRVNAVLANAPLAALWGPNPVPRAGGRCLDVIRLLRITTGSPVVEATSTRCQGVLDAFRGRAAAGRALIDSARRTLTELGMRHALLEVDQFAGIVELVADDPASAEPHLRRAYDGFRRMKLDADTAETAALLARACLALGRDAEADELCTESERLAGHALKASIAWRTVRAQLLARSGAHDEARRMAEDAVAVAGRTDLLVDHGDACLTLATVLGAAGDAAGARAAAERAIGLYELKGAAALAEMARGRIGKRDVPAAPAPTETPVVEPDNACVRAIRQLSAAIDREAWHEYEQMFATDVVIESRRKIVGFHIAIPSREWAQQVRRLRGIGAERHRVAVIAVRGERLALTRLEIAAEDASPGAPQEEVLELQVINEEGRFELGVFFDVEDMDAAMAELDAAHAKLQERPPLENAASRLHRRLWTHFLTREWEALAETMTDDAYVEDHRPVVNYGLLRGRDAVVEALRVDPDLGLGHVTPTVVATRGERLVLSRLGYSPRDKQPEAFHLEMLAVVEVNAENQMAACVVFDAADFDAAFAELDTRYLAGEAAEYAQSWSRVMEGFAAVNRHELPDVAPDWVNVDHRRAIAIAPGDMTAYLQALLDDSDTRAYIEAVHRLNNLGAVITQAAHGVSSDGFDAEWRVINLSTSDGIRFNRFEIFDEADLDTALARFDELSRPTPRLENAASQVFDRSNAYFSSGDWAAMSEVMAQNMIDDDRRRTVNAGIRRGRDAEIANCQAVAETGTDSMTSAVLAIRGERLALCRTSIFGRDNQPEAHRIEMLSVVEINVDDQLATHVAFDLDDFDAAFTELDARYLVGEAAPYAHVWQSVMDTLGEANRHEPGPIIRGLSYVDHRRVSFGSADFGRAVEELWALVPDARYRVTAVHAIDAHGTVASLVIEGTDSDGNKLQWPRIVSLVPDELRMDVYEDDDIDTALARFEEMRPQERRLENAATKVEERFQEYFAARDWAAMGETLADDISADDRRRVVNAGIRHGRDAKVADMRATADLGTKTGTSTVIAIRGQRLALVRIRLSGRDQRPDAFHTEMLGVTEINADNRMAARILFDVDDNAAFEELDARYLAGEAAEYSHAWSVVAEAYAAFNRRELLATTPDWVNIDHRRGAAFAPGDMIAYIQAAWDDSPDTKIYIAAVHRLSNLGAVVTHVAHGISQYGFGAEWRGIHVLTVEGDMLSRSELFDEADIDAAIAKFDKLICPAPRLENAASQVVERFNACFAERNWAAMAEMLAEDIFDDDRRRVVNAGTLRGRDDVIADVSALADIGATNVASEVIALRGARLVLSRARYSGNDERPEAFRVDALDIIEIDADERLVAHVAFDLHDIDAAFAELDARYVAGEAAAYAHTWSVIARGLASFNRRELPGFTPDSVNIDHRRARGFAPGDLTAYIGATWDLAPDVSAYAEAVHRLSNLGVVFAHAVRGTSRDGFDAEWREICLATVDGDLISRIEMFDEDDIDAALAHFDELGRPVPRLENAATRLTKRFQACFAAGNWDAMAGIFADDILTDDRRPVLTAGTRHGRDTNIEDWRTVAEVGLTDITSTVVATRGNRLALSRFLISTGDQRPEAFHNDVLGIVEINADNRISAGVMFDLDDIDAAFAELETRYLAGEAAEHAHTWSVIARGFDAVNRREIPATTLDFVDIDHRHVAGIGSGDLRAYLSAAFDDLADNHLYVESVHRLTGLGAVVTHVAKGASREGLDVEWRLIDAVTIDGDLINRYEMFDETDLDAALATFDELSRPAGRLENAASQVVERFSACFSALDWGTLAEILAADYSADDRRRVVNAGMRHGRSAEMENLRAVANLGFTAFTSAVIATRGEHLVLIRLGPSVQDQRETFHMEMIGVIEIDAENRLVATVVFDVDDIDAAFEELEARYLAGEAAAHSHTWLVITRASAAFNRHVMPPTTPDWVNIDHRKVTAFAPGDMTAYMRATFGVAPDIKFYIEAVHRLTNLGAVFTQAGRGISHEGFEAEWRDIVLMSIEGDQFNRCEVFDEADLDAALVRFDELSRQLSPLENVATRTRARMTEAFNRRDVDAYLTMVDMNGRYSDRRKGLRDEGVTRRQVVQAVFEAPKSWRWEIDPVAVRGNRLGLARERYRDTDAADRPITAETITLTAVDNDGLVCYTVHFDPDDINAAFAELTAHWIASGEVAHPEIIESARQLFEATNRHEWDALAALEAGATYVNHRQLSSGDSETIAEHWLSLRTTASLIPDLWVEVAEILTHSAAGLVTNILVKGTTAEGAAIDLPAVILLFFDGARVTRMEAFDPDNRGAALARFEELNSR